MIANAKEIAELSTELKRLTGEFDGQKADITKLVGRVTAIQMSALSTSIGSELERSSTRFRMRRLKNSGLNPSFAGGQCTKMALLSGLTKLVGETQNEWRALMSHCRCNCKPRWRAFRKNSSHPGPDGFLSQG